MQRPTSDDYDPEIEGYVAKKAPSKYWNLDQTLAWVIWRKSEIVGSLVDGKRPTSALSRLLETPGWKTLQWEGVEIPCVAMPSDLMIALRNGSVRARGSHDGKGDRQWMTPEIWEELEIYASEYDYSIAVSTANAGKPWTDLLFLFSEVTDIFKEDGSSITEQKSFREKPLSLEQLVAKELKHLLSVERPETFHGWRRKITQSLNSRPSLAGEKLDTLAKYSRDLLNEYEANRKKDAGTG